MQNASDGTIDQEYTFGLDVEMYLTVRQHAKLAVFKSKLDNMENTTGRTWNRLDVPEEYSSNF